MMQLLGPRRGTGTPNLVAAQGDLFIAPTFNPRSALLPSAGTKLTLVIGCSGQKRKKRTTAAELYTSSRFKRARAIAESLRAEYLIASAKHGILKPDQIISPYDMNLSDLDGSERRDWGRKIAQQLSEVRGQLCILCTAEYADPIVEAYEGVAKLVSPLSKIVPRHHAQWHEQALAFSRRVEAMRELYQAIDKRRRTGGMFTLSELGMKKLPVRGVYIFIDKSERNFLGRRGRIVRIGTHAVSEGSKSTLRNRLRNHAGLRDGTGNHRGSIFRLHVGRAVLERENASAALPSWGEGQDAPIHVRAHEVSMEQLVSDYLKKLEVLVLDIDDTPSKHSLRAIVERQLIALCSESLIPIDRPSKAWLGLSSPMRLIAESGLWNLRDVGRAYDPQGQGSVRDLISLDLL
ncbi:conserved protein of unknown function [Candidatus Filomicrobium marinum]|uniref:GIY-YIG nuclease family protein n=1 Tax=Candidatus Filomicrobium marinum TaxID=1608628 RepID=A0A0D6JEY1_9HYPH|nr:DUF6884 domain-containing protein [Candidatus Filomicrobium marinum]CPR19093.1 conserved protein of unknown function [Candidatus Filomicrobium marinum]